MSELRVLGVDPSLRNWGIAWGIYCPESNQLIIDRLGSIQPVLPTGKQVRQNSIDLEAARQLSESITVYAKCMHAVFVEVPVGSQSARAMASYGICVGVLGALRASGVPFFEVTPLEVKRAGAGNKTATKHDMITWAMRKHPEAPWPYHNGKVNESKAEHQADAIAAIYAGIASNPFQQMLPLMAA